MIRRVAAIPSSSGMTTSISTTSGLVVPGELYRLPAVVRLGDHDHAGALERLLDHPAGEWIVVGDDRADGRVIPLVVLVLAPSRAGQTSSSDGGVRARLRWGSSSPWTHVQSLPPTHHPFPPRAARQIPQDARKGSPSPSAAHGEADTRDQPGGYPRRNASHQRLRRAQHADATLKNLLGVLSAKLDLCASLPVFEFEADTEGYPEGAAAFHDLAECGTAVVHRRYSSSCEHCSSGRAAQGENLMTRVVIVADSGAALASLTAAVATVPGAYIARYASSTCPLGRIVAPLAPDLVVIGDLLAPDHALAEHRRRAPRRACGEGRRAQLDAGGGLARRRPPRRRLRSAARAASSRKHWASCFARSSPTTPRVPQQSPRRVQQPAAAA